MLRPRPGDGSSFFYIAPSLRFHFTELGFGDAELLYHKTRAGGVGVCGVKCVIGYQEIPFPFPFLPALRSSDFMPTMT